MLLEKTGPMDECLSVIYNINLRMIDITNQSAFLCNDAARFLAAHGTWREAESECACFILQVGRA